MRKKQGIKMFLEPEKMSRVEIEFPQQYINEVTQTLVRSGHFQIEDSSALNMRKTSEFDDEMQERYNQYGRLETDILAVMKQLDIKPGKMPEIEPEVIENPEEILQELEAVRVELGKMDQRTEEIRKTLENGKRFLNIMEPFKDLDIEFGAIRNRRYIYSILGIIPTEKIERFKQSFARIPFVLLELSQEGPNTIVLLIGNKIQQDFLIRTARSAYLNSLDLPDEYHGTPAQIVAQTQAEMDKGTQELETLRKDIEALRKKQADLLVDRYWRVRMSRTVSEITNRFGRLTHDLLVVGWVPQDYSARFQKTLADISPDIIVDVTEENELEEGQKPPVALHHTKPVEGFQKLVTTYSTPNYQEIDPTILLLLTFPILFGAMFGDVGQGLFLALVGALLFSGKVSKLRGLSKLGPVVVLCGVSAAIFGFIYGSVFGFEELIKPLWRHPIEDIMGILILTFAGGALLLSIANILALVNDARRKNWAHMIFSGKGVAGLVLYWSLLGLLITSLTKVISLPKGLLIALALIAVVMIMSTGFMERLLERKRPLFEGGFLVYFIQSFFELFEALIGFLSNSLSYVRVGAFAVAHAGLSQVIMILAEMVGPTKGAGFWIVIVLGNLFIIGFEGMIVSIQTLRLEYYEFFSKFFSGGGTRYKPLGFLSSSK